MGALFDLDLLLRPEFLVAAAAIVGGALMAWTVAGPRRVRGDAQTLSTEAVAGSSATTGATAETAGTIDATPPQGGSAGDIADPGRDGSTGAVTSDGAEEPAAVGRQLESGMAPTVTFASVAGVDGATTELREVAEYLADRERFWAVGAQLPRGVVLQGPPGCGKTLLAKALAGEAGVAFHSVSATEFVEHYVGTGAKRVRGLFEAAKANAPAIVFIDELDAIGRQRSNHDSGGQEFDHTLNQLLVELDGFEDRAGLVVVGATNRPELLDGALLRPGRFDRRVHLQRPARQARTDILGLHAATRPVSREVDWDEVAAHTPGLSAADLANLVNEAALLAARRHHRTLTPDDVDDAHQRVTSGTPSEQRPRTAAELSRLAVHEAGHAVLSLMLDDPQPPARVSIIDRAGGASTSPWQLGDDHQTLTAAQLRERLILLLGGRAAELRVLGEPSTRAEDDLAQAAALARHMVERWAMTGRYELAGGPSEPRAPYVEASAGAHEVRQLLAWAEGAAGNVLAHHQALTQAVTDALKERETLAMSELEELLQTLGPDRHVPAPQVPADAVTAMASAADGLDQDASPPRLNGFPYPPARVTTTTALLSRKRWTALRAGAPLR